MKPILLTTLLLCSIVEMSNAQAELAVHAAPSSLVEAARLPVPTERASVSFPVTYQRLPSFPGGFDDMVVFIQQKIKYPAQATEAGIEGIVQVRLTLDARGTIEAAELVQPLGFGCDEEALRVVAQMPRWEPAQQGNFYVPSKIMIPIQFKLK